MAKTPEIDLRDSLIGNNLIINGDMQIAQRGTSFPAVAASDYTLDRWQYSKSGAMVHTITQDSDTPTLAESGYIFSNSLRLNLTTPDDSIITTDFCSIIQRIEGHIFKKIAHKPFTLSFWVKSTTTGSKNVAFRNGGDDRSYVAEYSINNANTWEKKVINVPAPPTSGTWNYTTGRGLDILFTLVTGSLYQTSSNAWQVGNFIGTSTATNGTATGATDFKITGVMLNEGTEALPFSLAGGNFANEFRLCQRYYVRYSGEGATTSLPGVGIGNGGTTPGIARYHFPTPVEMRVPPICSFASLTGLDGAANYTMGTILSSYSTTKVVDLDINTTTSTVLGRCTILYFTNPNSTSFFQLEAEL